MSQLEFAAVLRGVALLGLLRISPGGRGIFFFGLIVEVLYNYVAFQVWEYGYLPFLYATSDGVPDK
jgi:nicotinamide riboside transporter PnuC